MAQPINTNYYYSIAELVASGVLGGSRKRIMRMINEGVRGRMLKVEIIPSPFNPRGNDYRIKKSDAIAYAKFLNGLNK